MDLRFSMALSLLSDQRAGGGSPGALPSWRAAQNAGAEGPGLTGSGPARPDSGAMALDDPSVQAPQGNQVLQDLLRLGSDGASSAPFQGLAHGFTQPTSASADANQDGFITPAEQRTYALAHPPADPADANGDGFVSAPEAQTYAKDHGSIPKGHVVTASVDTFA